MSCCGGSGTTQDHPQEVIKIHDAAGNKPGAIQYNVAPGKHEESYLLAKVLVLGDAGVGKTSLVRRYDTGAFTGDYKATLGVDFIVKRMAVDNTNIKLQIWDTAGEERFRAIMPSFFRGAHAAIVVFDVTKKATFDNLKRWMSDLNQYIEGVSQGLFPVFILGNKTDIPEPDRVITTKQAEDFVASLGLPSVKYAETSAKDGSKVTETFEQIAGAVSKVMINPMYHR